MSTVDIFILESWDMRKFAYVLDVKTKLGSGLNYIWAV